MATVPARYQGKEVLWAQVRLIGSAAVVGGITTGGTALCANVARWRPMCMLPSKLMRQQAKESKHMYPDSEDLLNG